MGTNAQYEKLTAIVCRSVSEIHARMIVTRAFRACGIDGREPRPDELPQIVARIERSLKLFLWEGELEAARNALIEMLPRDNRELAAEQIEVHDEDDIVTARSRARELSHALGASGVPVQKAATIVSELARNIVSYTPGGYIELMPRLAPTRLTVRAVDRGTGIKNLDEILAGRYKSRTGLGMGLLGTKRIADSFEVRTGNSGTEIEVDIVF